jgi:transposase
MKELPNESTGKRVNVLTLPIVNANAAGIDVAATMHTVAVRPGADEVSVREFGAFTEDLYQIASWLKECEVTTVAMESTGVYWKQLYLVLVEQGFEVALVNASHVKNVSGKKTDMEDAMWIQKLHSCGLLRSSFLPDDATESLRSLVRHRKRLLEDSSKYVLRMQKALELMNIKLHSVISDLMGKTGKSIVEAILGGERKAENFLQYIDPRIKAPAETIRKSLEGNWRAEHLFLLEENYKLYEFIQQRVSRCDQEVEQYLQKQAAISNEGVMEEIPGDNSVKKKE